MPAHNLVDLTGRRFGRLTVAGRAPNDRRGDAMWRCLCDCGGSSVVLGASLRSGTRSCGCLRTESVIRRSLQHGEARAEQRTPEYTTWRQIMARCHCPTNRAYRYYGGRGIHVCRRWRDSFVDFLADMGRKPSPRHGIDRINNYKGYEPGNCRWATMSQQNRNKRGTKLSYTQAVSIARAMLGGAKGKDVARQYGVCNSYPYNILAGKAWPDALAEARRQTNATKESRP